MTDFSPQSENDDELLSAYLDGELSADERIAVEARLAADPAAQRLLDELRAASQAIQGLPAETVGYDLRDSILARAEQAMLASPTARPADADFVVPRDSLPQFTIGRTLRGWIWAFAALAAGLMIMFLQPGDERTASLPAVASRSDERLDRVAKLDGMPPLEPRSLDAPMAPAEPPSIPNGGVMDAAPASGPADQSQMVANSESSRAPHAAKALTAPEAEDVIEERAADRFGETERDLSELSTSTSSGKMPDVAQSQPEGVVASDALTARAAPANDDELLVVHVVMKRAALENDAFDRLLIANGIQIEAPPADKKTNLITRGARTDIDQLNDAMERDDQQPRDSTAVLVEAPADAIEACLTVLKTDEEHYAGVSVDDYEALDVAAAAQASSATTALGKQRTADLGRKFNRGKRPSRLYREMAGKDRYNFNEFNDFYEAGGTTITAGDGREGSGSGVAGVVPTEEDASQRYSRHGLGEQLGFGEKKDTGRGRAVRLRSWGLTDRRRQSGGEADVGGRGAATPEPSSASNARVSNSPKSDEVQQKAEAASAPTVDKLQVLFVLSPDEESASSPGNENRAQ